MPIPKNTINSNIISTETVIWEGPDIPCLDLCTGEKVSGVIAKIGTKLCTVITDLETLKTLDYSCVITTLDQINVLKDPETFSLKLLFQLLLDNDCKLKELIDNIKPSSVSTTVNLNGLNLNCITSEILNLCGQIPENLDVLKVTQAIINILCGLQDDVADILIRLITIETRLDSLGDPGSGGYTEPTITSCLSSIPTLMSEHIPAITDKAICSLRDIIGTEAELQDALSKQCLQDYISNGNIIQNANSLADSMANKEVIICDLIDRITNIENTCCNFGCNDIRIGFIQSYDITSNTYTIEFTYGAGTDIPSIFTDCGSTFVLTDWKGVTKTITNSSNTLLNGSTFTIPLTGSGLDATKPIQLLIKTCFTNSLNGLICKDCFGGTLDEGSTTNTMTCWEFVIPKTDALGCVDKFLSYDSLITTQGTYTCSTSNTSINNNLVLPIFSTPNNILNNCRYKNTSVLLTLNNQSTLNPPQLRIFIVNTSPLLYITITGTLNTTCLC